MKTTNYILTVIVAFSLQGFAFSQEPCKVLTPEIADNYDGPCKKGLAHGEGNAWGVDFYSGRFREGLPDGFGKYNWANGDVFEGQWKQGKRNGNGTLKFEKEGKQMELTGIWKDNEYMRSEKIPSYSLGHILNVERYSIRRTGDGNMILLTTYEQNRVNSKPQNLHFQLDTGSSILLGQSSGYEGVSFPAEVKITYNVADKLGQGAVVRVRLEVTINEPGAWEIRIYN